MKFQKAEVELILFDNSDVIVTSPGDLPCNNRPQYAWCLSGGQGDSTKPNECDFLEGHLCVLNSTVLVCNASGTQIFVNSPGPNNPVDM